MSQLERQDLDGGIIRLSLASGSGNPLTPELVEELASTVDTLHAAPPRALVIDGGRGKLFSGGFDLPTIAPWDRPRLSAFFERFTEIVEGLIQLPAPVIVANHAAAIAGGFILSLAADLRVVLDGPVKLGLPEVDLGVGVPAGTQVLLAERTTPQVARRMALTARTIDAPEALRVGYADELAADPQGRALELAAFLAGKPGEGVATTKAVRARDLLDRFHAAEVAGRDAFLDSWFSEAGQRVLKLTAARLSR